MKPFNTVGLTIFSVSALVLIIFGLYKFFGEIFKDTSMPVVVRWAIIGVILGIIIILISLVIERIKEKRE